MLVPFINIQLSPTILYQPCTYVASCVDACECMALLYTVKPETLALLNLAKSDSKNFDEETLTKCW